MANKFKAIARSLGSTENIDKRLDDIECSLKKLELNLRLVDADDIDASEFSELKDKIKIDCKTDVKKTEEFLTSMTTKRYNNRLKKIVNYLSFICPVLSIINQTSIPNIISTELAPDVIKDALTSLHLYAGHASTKFQNVLDNTSSNVDLVDKALETDLFSLPDDLKGRISDLKTSVSSKGSAVSKSVSKLANDIASAPGNLVVKLPLITKYVAELCSSLKIHVGKNISKTLLNKYNILYFTYCLSMFYILLHGKIKFRVDKDSNIFDIFNTTNATIMENSGGKKNKKVKKSKGSKTKKIV
jgi:hypothetical protein